MSARLLPLHSDVPLPHLVAFQQFAAVQGAIDLELLRAKNATTPAELSACRKRLLTIEIWASLAGDLVSKLQDDREREQ